MRTFFFSLLLFCSVAHSQQVLEQHESKVLDPNNSGRSRHAVAYDSVNKKAVIYGGHSYYSGLLQDTLILDTDLNLNYSILNWDAAINYSPQVGVRYSHKMIFDKENAEVYLFGGCTSGNPTVNPAGAVNSMFKIDLGLSSPSWTAVNYNGPNVPAARCRHAMTYVPRNSATGGPFIVLAGGHDPAANIIYNDTWLFDIRASTWTQLNNSGLPAIYGAVMTYNPALRQIVLAGGRLTGTVFNTLTYEMRGSLTSPWQAKNFGGNNFTGFDSSMAYDSFHKRVSIYGGLLLPSNYLRSELFDYDPLLGWINRGTFSSFPQGATADGRYASSMFHVNHLNSLFVAGGETVLNSADNSDFFEFHPAPSTIISNSPIYTLGCRAYMAGPQTTFRVRFRALPVIGRPAVFEVITPSSYAGSVAFGGYGIPYLNAGSGFFIPGQVAPNNCEWFVDLAQGYQFLPAVLLTLPSPSSAVAVATLKGFVPNDPAWVGFTLNYQGVFFDGGFPQSLVNAGVNLRTTNYIEVTFGY